MGLLTELPSGRHLGDALLDPTRIYASFVRELLASPVVPKFLNGITGHGFLKIMRADVAVRYEITRCLRYRRSCSTSWTSWGCLRLRRTAR